MKESKKRGKKKKREKKKGTTCSFPSPPPPSFPRPLKSSLLYRFFPPYGMLHRNFHSDGARALLRRPKSVEDDRSRSVASPKERNRSPMFAALSRRPVRPRYYYSRHELYGTRTKSLVSFSLVGVYQDCVRGPREKRNTRMALIFLLSSYLSSREERLLITTTR